MERGPHDSDLDVRSGALTKWAAKPAPVSQSRSYIFGSDIPARVK